MTVNRRAGSGLVNERETNNEFPLELDLPEESASDILLAAIVSAGYKDVALRLRQLDEAGCSGLCKFSIEARGVLEQGGKGELDSIALDLVANSIGATDQVLTNYLNDQARQMINRRMGR